MKPQAQTQTTPKSTLEKPEAAQEQLHVQPESTNLDSEASQYGLGTAIAKAIGCNKQELLESRAAADLLDKMRKQKEEQEYFNKYGRHMNQTNESYIHDMMLGNL